MARYELVQEILNECPRNQMRDVFISEVETDDPKEYVRTTVKGDAVEITREDFSDGSVIFHVSSAGLLQKFSFTPDD